MPNKTRKTDRPVAYTVHLNEIQLKIIRNALEEWARLRMGQTSDLADALAFQHFDYGNHTDDEFDERIRRRNDGEILLKQAMNALSGTDYNHWRKTDETLIALDMWSVIRNFFWHLQPPENRKTWTTDADPVFLWGPEPGITVDKDESNGS